MGGILSPTSRETEIFNFFHHVEKNHDNNGIDYITTLPTDLLKLTLCEFLFPFEQFKFARVNKFFASIYSKERYNFKYFSVRDRNCWFSYIHEHYVDSGGWLLFKNKTFDTLSVDIRLCLMYFIIHYDAILNYQTVTHKNAVKLKAIIPENVNHLRIIGSDNVNIRLTKFIRNVLYYSSRHNPINAIYIERCNLSDNDVCVLSYSLIQRKYTSNLRGFSIGGNPKISDQYIGLFFDVISKQCPSLRTLGLHSTNITNKSCRIIFDFYATKKKQQKEQQKEIGEKRKKYDDGEKGDGEQKQNVPQHNANNNIALEKLYLMRNTNITEQGIDILNEIFVKKYLDDTRLEHQVVINCARCGLKSRKDTWNRTIRV